MTVIKHIVFDVGQVLIYWNPEIPFRHLIPNDQKRQWFLREVCNGQWNVEQDRGRTWHEAEEMLIEQHPEEEVHIRAFRKHWVEMLPHQIEDSVVILKALISNGTDVTLLTNFNQETFPLAKEMYPFLKLARGETVSGEIRLIKPDRQIYDHHTRIHDLDPQATLFFDDSQKNTDGAKDFGWHAELFTSPEQMARDLANYGVDFGTV